MMCLTIGCLHGKSNRMRHMGGTCWDLWQVCPCCASVLVEFGAIKYELHKRLTGCVRAIKNELSTDDLYVNPDPELVAKIAKKKKYPRKMSYDGVVM